MTYVSDLFQKKVNEVIVWIDDNTPQGLNALGQPIIRANYTKAGSQLHSSTYEL